ncbi:MAG: hypothetical protein HY270_17880 [Deltaproteobacteria bacterium]|nr:hypothetical protein [Deltaproteobacteria bacterium]
MPAEQRTQIGFGPIVVSPFLFRLALHTQWRSTALSSTPRRDGGNPPHPLLIVLLRLMQSSLNSHRRLNELHTLLVESIGTGQDLGGTTGVARELGSRRRILARHLIQPGFRLSQRRFGTLDLSLGLRVGLFRSCGLLTEVFCFRLGLSHRVIYCPEIGTNFV